MKRVLIAMIPENIAEWIEIRLGGIRVVSRDSVAMSLEAMQADTWDLILIQHTEFGPQESEELGSLDLLEAIRQTDKGQDTPVIYVLDSPPSRTLMNQLVDTYQVARILVHPLDPEDLLVEVSRTLRLSQINPGDERTTALKKLWQKFLPTTISRIETLENMGIALVEGRDDQALLVKAAGEAHKLAGSLGSFGYPQGSVLASRLEQMLSEEVSVDRIPEFTDLVLKLRSLINTPGAVIKQSVEPLGQQVLLLDAPGQPIQLPVKQRNFELLRSEHPGQAIKHLQDSRPGAIIVHLGVSTEEEERFEFLRNASRRHPDLPVLVLLPETDLEHRVKALRNGAQYLLDSTAPAGQIQDAIDRVLQQKLERIPRVLILDDDPVFNASVEDLLTRAGMRAQAIVSPADLMETLHSFKPDIALVDINLPIMSGIEVCRLLRGLSRWNALPIVLMTAEKQSDTVIKVFRCGADDYVAKPVVGPELIARIRNRLERQQTVIDLGSTDPVTGLASWTRARPRLRSFLDLSRRSGQPLTLVLLELDDLKNMSPQSADRELACLGQTFGNSFRSEDTVAKYVGDRLILGLYGMRLSDGLERLNGLLLRYSERWGKTFSAGLATFPQDGDSLDSLINMADRALEKAQGLGGGRVVSGQTTYSIGNSTKQQVDVGVVEDDALLAPLVLHALENKGYQTFWISDGLEASRKLVGKSSDRRARVLLLDVDLPGLSGYQLLRQLKEAGNLDQTKVILLTARTAQSDVLKSLEMGAVDHVSKPFSLPVLLEKVRQALKSGD